MSESSWLENLNLSDSMKKTFIRMEQEREYEKKETLEGLNYRVEKLKAKAAEMSNLEYELSLVKNDVITYISTTIWQSPLNIFWCVVGNLLWESWKWFNYKDDIDNCPEDAEKFDEYEKSFNFVTSTIKREFLHNSDDFEITEVLLHNYDVSIVFTYKHKLTGKEFSIEVPNFRAANDKTYFDFLYGYRISKRDDCVISTVASGWDVKELSDAIIKYCEEKDIITKELSLDV